MLELRDICFGYRKGRPVLEGVSLDVDPCERVALRAPSGFGKSTLCRIAAGYLKPWTGGVLVDGVPLPDKGPLPVQMVFQHPENAVDPRQRMSSMLKEAGSIRDDLLARFGVDPQWLSRYPHELSGGELQRFCIVRALMANPGYLVCDEISTMLDAATQAQIWHELMRQCETCGIGMLLVSHSPALTECVATRVVDLA